MKKLSNYLLSIGMAFSAVTSIDVVFASSSANNQIQVTDFANDGFEPPTNPFLAYSPWPMSHRNPYSQGSSPFAGPELDENNVEPVLDQDFEALGLGNIVLTYSTPYPDGSHIIWGSTTDYVFKVDPSGEDLVTVAKLKRDKPEQAESSAYILLDINNNYYLTSDKEIQVYADVVAGDPSSDIELVRSYTLPDDLLRYDNEVIAGMNMTYDGHIVVVTTNGLVGVISSDFKKADYAQLDADEVISNSVSLDEEGGIYIVSSKYMRRLQWTGKKLSQAKKDGAWVSTYNTGPEEPLPGRLGVGSGTTPSLMGTGDMDKFVVIGDGQEQMNLTLFWRDEIPTDWEPIAPGVDRRVAAQVPITFGLDDPSRTTTEQSVLVRGYSAAVVSNDYGELPNSNRLPGIFSNANVLLTNLSAYAPKGVEKFTWSPSKRTLESAWNNPDISCPNGIPTMSVASNLMYCWGQRDAVWTLEALDWDTGDSAFYKELGIFPNWNSAYAATEIGLDRNILSGTVGGIARIQPDMSGITVKSKVRFNGELTQGTVSLNYHAGDILVDVNGISAQVPDFTFTRMPIPIPVRGAVVQYGKTISFAGVGLEKGFSSMAQIEMDPPMEISNGTYWVPLGFLEHALSGEISVENNADDWIIDISAEAAQPIGSVVPEAKIIADELNQDFDIRQGEISLTNAVELYASGYLLDSNGNNANNSYLVVQNPISPRAKFYNRMPMALSMDQDEALVWVGYTPPETKYFSYQNYIVTRTFLEYPPSIKKLYARLGDSVNNYNMETSDDPFNQFHVFIISNNVDTQEAITEAIVRSGISQDRIVNLDIPAETGPGTDMRFGQGPIADSFNFLHRASLFSSDEDKSDYTSQPPLEILRVTPKKYTFSNPLPRPMEAGRMTGVSEQDDPELGSLLEELQDNIIATYGKDYKYAKVLKTSTWLYPGGDVAIEEGEDVLGETNDTLYLKSEEFNLNDDDLIVVFGPNHTQTGKSVYSNVSLYGATIKNGIGGINSVPATTDAPSILSYFGSAAQYMPKASQPQQDKLYVYKFARHAVGDNTFVIPDNSDGRFEGFNDGDRVHLGFRSYVDLLSGVGPYPGDVRDWEFFDFNGPADSEVYFDQVIIFTNSKDDPTAE